MLVNSIKIRPFNVGGAFEIVLPNGKVVLIDPFFTDEFDKAHTVEDVTGADYVILTHAHFDHDRELGYFVKKFNPLVFCGALSAEAVLKYHNIPYDNIVPVFPGQSFTLKDFSIEFWAAKHNPSGGKTFQEFPQTTKNYGNGDNAHARCDQLGSLESLDFILTTNNNYSVAMISGRTLWQEPMELCRKKHPNLLLRQAGVRKGGDRLTGQQVSASELAELFTSYHAQVIFPFHHEVLVRRWGKEATDLYFDEVAAEVAKRSPGALMVNPVAWKWYSIGTCVALEDENTKTTVR